MSAVVLTLLNMFWKGKMLHAKTTLIFTVSNTNLMFASRISGCCF